MVRVVEIVASKIVRQKYISFAEYLVAEHTLSEKIILNEVSVGGSPAIFASLFVVKNAQWGGRRY